MMDLHCHLDLYDDPRRVLRETKAAGVYTLAVTNLPAGFSPLQALVADARRVRVALGIHPALAHTPYADFRLFRANVARTRYVGEVGLDGSPRHRDQLDVQRRVFEDVLRACEDVGGRILSVHSRGAAALVTEALVNRPGAGIPILHWFSGTASELDGAIAAGCWFSVNAAMSGSPRGRRLICGMPRQRVLLETDGPYTRFRGVPSRPVDASALLDELACLWQSSVDDVRVQLTTNLHRLTGTTA